MSDRFVEGFNMCLLFNLMWCAAGIESIHHMLRYIHLGKGYRILVFLMNINCLMQLLCVGVVMGKSENLVSLIGNFVGEWSVSRN